MIPQLTAGLPPSEDHPLSCGAVTVRYGSCCREIYHRPSRPFCKFAVLYVGTQPNLSATDADDTTTASYGIGHHVVLLRNTHLLYCASANSIVHNPVHSPVIVQSTVQSTVHLQLPVPILPIYCIAFVNNSVLSVLLSRP